MENTTKVTSPPLGGQTRALAAATSTKVKVVLSSTEVPEGSGLPNFVAMGHRTATYWFFICFAMIVGALITRKVVRDRKFTYRSEATLVFRGGIDGPPTKEMVMGAGTRTKELLLSQNSLKKIIQECKLAPGLRPNANYAPMIEGMRLKIEFKPRAGDTYGIAYEGNSAFEAQLVVSKLAEAVIEFNTTDRRNRIKSSLEFNLAELRKAEENLVRIQKEVARFVAEHPTAAATEVPAAGAMVKADIRKTNAAKKGLDVPFAGAAPPGGGGGRRKPDRPVAAAKADAEPAVDPVLLSTRAAARAELLAARKDLADKSVRYTEQHPDVRASKARVGSAESALASADAAVEAAMAAAARPAPRPAAPTGDDPYGDAPAPPRLGGGAAAPRPSAVAAAAPPVKGDTSADMVDLDSQWTQLNRALTKANQNFLNLDAKVFASQQNDVTMEAGYTPELDLLDPATRPGQPSGAPNRSMLTVGLGVSVVVGILLSIGFGLILDDRIYASSEIDDLRVVPVLVTIPKPKSVSKGPWWRLRA